MAVRLKRYQLGKPQPVKGKNIFYLSGTTSFCILRTCRKTRLPCVKWREPSSAQLVYITSLTLSMALTCLPSHLLEITYISHLSYTVRKHEGLICYYSMFRWVHIQHGFDTSAIVKLKRVLLSNYFQKTHQPQDLFTNLGIVFGINEGWIIVKYYPLNHVTGLVFKRRVLLVIAGLANVFWTLVFLESIGHLYQVHYAACFPAFLCFLVAKIHLHPESSSLYDITLFI